MVKDGAHDLGHICGQQWRQACLLLLIPQTSTDQVLPKLQGVYDAEGVYGDFNVQAVLNSQSPVWWNWGALPPISVAGEQSTSKIL